MSSTPIVPLASRPRRTRLPRVPTQREASRALRRTAPLTTGHTWTQSGLPGYPCARAGVPWSESLTSVLIVVLLFLPLFVWTQGAAWVLITGGVAVLVMSYLLWARRVLVGERYVAVRQLGRYHVASVDHVRHLELRPSQHGGVLCLHTDDGRTMRLRRAEVSRPEINTALRAMVGSHAGTRDARVEHLLELPHEEARIRHRYLANVVQ